MKAPLVSVKKTRLSTPRTVAICGFASSSRHLAPYDNRTLEIWGCNEAYNFEFMQNSAGEFRADRWFQIHEAEDFTRENNPNDHEHYEWLQAEHNFPIYMQERFSEIPNAKKYPLERYDKFFFDNAYTADMTTLEKQAWLDAYEHGYFTSTFAYMMAMAITEGFKRIEIWGFHIGSQSEYLYQKGACEFWVGQALGRGIEVILAGSSPIMKGELYGYEFSQIVQAPELEDRIMELDKEILPLQHLTMQLQGARKENLYQQQQCEDAEQLSLLTKRHLALTDKELEEGAKINFFLGAINENHGMRQQISERHPENGDTAGWVDRLSLEVRLNRLDDESVDARSSLDAVTGARMETDRILDQEDVSPEMELVLRARREKLFQTEVDWDNKLNYVLGGKTEIKRYILKTESRTPNFTDDKGFGNMLLLDLSNPIKDVLELGKTGGAS